MSQPYNRIYNFSAGPSTLPVSVLEQARDELLNYGGTGMSVMEMSHRSKAFETIIGEAETNLRSLLGIPANYKVLFLQGGASLQFSLIPISFLSQGKTAEYVITGSWAKKAIEAAKLEGETKVVWDGKAGNYSAMPDLGTVDLSGDAAYVHITSNETIQGIQFQSDPTTPSPLIADMSSDILSRPVDVSKYGLIYAGAQKNMGPAGVTLVVIREDLLELVPQNLHPMLDYKLQADNGSLYNTPPCWSIYICGLVYKLLVSEGGLATKAQANQAKSKIVYDAIDGSRGFYKGHASLESRSTMNVTFTLPSDDLTKAFIKEAEANGLDGLKGHRSVGGCRASIYNAFPVEGCQVLAQVMSDFAKRNG